MHPSSSAISHIVFWHLLCVTYLWKKIVFLSPFSIQIARLLSLQVDSSASSNLSFFCLRDLRRFNSSNVNAYEGHFSKISAIFFSIHNSSKWFCIFLLSCQRMTTFFNFFNFAHSRWIEESSDQYSIDFYVFLIREEKHVSIIQVLLNLKGGEALWTSFSYCKHIELWSEIVELMVHDLILQWLPR